MAKSLPMGPVIKWFRGHDHAMPTHLSLELVVALLRATKRLGLSEPARVGVAKGEQCFPVRKHPIEAVIGKMVDRITLLAAVPDMVDTLNALADGLDRIFRAVKIFHQPIKQHLAVVLPFDVFPPAPHLRRHFLRNIDGAIVSKHPFPVHKRLGMGKPDQFASLQFQGIGRPPHMPDQSSPARPHTRSSNEEFVAVHRLGTLEDARSALLKPPDPPPITLFALLVYVALP